MVVSVLVDPFYFFLPFFSFFFFSFCVFLFVSDMFVCFRFVCLFQVCLFASGLFGCFGQTCVSSLVSIEYILHLFKFHTLLKKTIRKTCYLDVQLYNQQNPPILKSYIVVWNKFLVRDVQLQLKRQNRPQHCYVLLGRRCHCYGETRKKSVQILIRIAKATITHSNFGWNEPLAANKRNHLDYDRLQIF